jgi:hypothetical protein
MGGPLEIGSCQIPKPRKVISARLTSAAAIDRLVHHSIIIEINLPSYRLESSQKKIQQQPLEEEQTSGSKG